MATLTGSAKLSEVTKLLGKLSADLQQSNLSDDERNDYLEKLKVHGRDPTNADPIFTENGIKVLARHAFESPSRTTSQNALRCLANALVLKPTTRQILLDLDYAPKASELLKNDSRDDEFLLSRIIFLLTYTSKLDIENLVDKHGLADIICTNIGRHATRETRTFDPMEDMSLTEGLKLLFNLASFCPQRKNSFSAASPHIIHILSKREIPSPKPLDPVISALINASLNIPLDAEGHEHSPISKAASTSHLDRLVLLLEKSTKAYPETEYDHVLSPLLTLLRNIYAVAPSESKAHLKKVLLPSDEDRAEVLGKGTSLPSRLLRLVNNTSTPTLRDVVSGLLFELSDKDATTFVQNIGYGLASGFLFQHKIPIPDNLTGTTDSGEASKAGQSPSTAGRVNPITGQFLDKEPEVPEVEMTQEEKEREAERLFVLFERLRATGVMSVENPVTKAYQEGRFEELPDDA